MEGDGQADLSVHGGVDKALYAYPFDTYKTWERLRPEDTFRFGAFGENLCFDYLDEDAIYIGDTFSLGDAVVQVTQPRFPCFKLGIKFNDVSVIKQFMTLNRPGVYFRVLKEGKINLGDQLSLIAQEEIKVSVLELFNLTNKTSDEEKQDHFLRIREILKLKSLNHEWRERMESWLLR